MAFIVSILSFSLIRCDVRCGVVGWRYDRVINYTEHSGTLASPRSGVKLSCQRCLSDFPNHTGRRRCCLTAARHRSSPAAAFHLACNSSAPNTLAQAQSTPAHTPRIAETYQRMAGERDGSPSKTTPELTEDGVRWNLSPVSVITC